MLGKQVFEWYFFLEEWVLMFRSTQDSFWVFNCVNCTWRRGAWNLPDSPLVVPWPTVVHLTSKSYNSLESDANVNGEYLQLLIHYESRAVSAGLYLYVSGYLLPPFDWCLSKCEIKVQNSPFVLPKERTLPREFNQWVKWTARHNQRIAPSLPSDSTPARVILLEANDLEYKFSVGSTPSLRALYHTDGNPRCVTSALLLFLFTDIDYVIHRITFILVVHWYSHWRICCFCS